MAVSMLVWRDCACSRNILFDEAILGDWVTQTYYADSSAEVEKALEQGKVDILLFASSKDPDRMAQDLAELAHRHGTIYAPVLAIAETATDQQIERLFREGVECVLFAPVSTEVLTLELARTLGVEEVG